MTLLLVWSVGCKKKREEPINPDFASTVAGTYSITTYEIFTDTLKFPYNGMTGTFDVKKIDLTHVQTGYTFYVPARGISGPYSASYNAGESELRNESGNKGSFTVYRDSKKVGTISPVELRILVQTQGGISATISARK